MSILARDEQCYINNNNNTTCATEKLRIKDCFVIGVSLLLVFMLIFIQSNFYNVFYYTPHALNDNTLTKFSELQFLLDVDPFTELNKPIIIAESLSYGVLLIVIRFTHNQIIINYFEKVVDVIRFTELNIRLVIELLLDVKLFTESNKPLIIQNIELLLDVKLLTESNNHRAIQNIDLLNGILKTQMFNNSVNIRYYEIDSELIYTVLEGCKTCYSVFDKMDYFVSRTHIMFSRMAHSYLWDDDFSRIDYEDNSYMYILLNILDPLKMKDIVNLYYNLCFEYPIINYDIYITTANRHSYCHLAPCSLFIYEEWLFVKRYGIEYKNYSNPYCNPMFSSLSEPQSTNFTVIFTTLFIFLGYIFNYFIKICILYFMVVALHIIIIFLIFYVFICCVCAIVLIVIDSLTISLNVYM